MTVRPFAVGFIRVNRDAVEGAGNGQALRLAAAALF
jgi:hypothetical protein